MSSFTRVASEEASGMPATTRRVEGFAIIAAVFLSPPPPLPGLADFLPPPLRLVGRRAFAPGPGAFFASSASKVSSASSATSTTNTRLGSSASRLANASSMPALFVAPIGTRISHLNVAYSRSSQPLSSGSAFVETAASLVEKRWKYDATPCDTAATRNEPSRWGFVSATRRSASALSPETYAPTTSRPPGSTAEARRRSSPTSDSACRHNVPITTASPGARSAGPSSQPRAPAGPPRVSCSASRVATEASTRSDIATDRSAAVARRCTRRGRRSS